MPLVSLIAEGVGPFKSLELDLSNGKGEPHPGPHILAGVNGSGKSTVLRTIAWVLDQGENGFQHEDWQQMLRGYETSRALLVIRPQGCDPYVWACSKGRGDDVVDDLTEWAGLRLSASRIARQPVDALAGTIAGSIQDPNTNTTWLHFRGPDFTDFGRNWGQFNFAAYSPSRSLRHLSAPDLSTRLSDAFHDCLAFESTVQNESIQSWLLSLYSKRAIARERKQTGEQYTRSLERFEAALRKIYDERVSFEVEIEPRLQPCLRMLGHSLNFSQLPDGVRSTVAWVADFMMREDLVAWDPALGGRRPGVLLLDEVDAHLHPIWQRRLLPAMREALPDVQIVVTSHSPFVISSCPNSRVHVLDLDADGQAHVRPPVDAPIGDSVTTTLKGIFGVDSRFDIQTERELNEWYELEKRKQSGTLTTLETGRLNELTIQLGERSEELRALVATPREMPKAVLDDLLGSSRPAGKPGRNRNVRA
jgi:predicted ATP-binding protein involved in virulence